MKNGLESDSITPKDLAKRIGCNRRTIYTAIYKKRLNTFKGDKNWTFIKKDAAFNDFIASSWSFDRAARAAKNRKKPKDIPKDIPPMDSIIETDYLVVQMHVKAGLFNRIATLLEAQVVVMPLPEFCEALIAEALAKRGL